ncbi:hypothetical protein Hanom_Chr16g01488191 [Helianthus anomalus]
MATKSAQLHPHGDKFLSNRNIFFLHLLFVMTNDTETKEYLNIKSWKKNIQDYKIVSLGIFRRTVRKFIKEMTNL